MKKFVINTENWHLNLTEEHVEWLRANGHPEADSHFCENDRSNPDLIACVEAVRESKRHLIEEANRLKAAFEKAKEDGKEADEAIADRIDFLLMLLNGDKNSIIREISRVLWAGCKWIYADRYATPKRNVSIDLIWGQLNAISAVFEVNRDKLIAIYNARRDFYHYCNKHSLMIQWGEVKCADGLEIKSYDETRFSASVKFEDGEYVGHDYEVMELKPFLTRETVASYVNAGDADGLFEFIQSIAIGNSIECRG